MKAVASFVYGVICFSASVSFAAIPAPYASYNFNGNALDSSTNAFNGTINGATSAVGRFGQSNTALSFLGGQSVTLPINFSSIQNYSVSAWMMRPQQGYSYVVANDGFFAGFLFKWGWPVDGTEELSFYSGNGVTWYGGVYYTNVPNNEWINLVGTSDSSGNVTTYINGVAVASTNMGTPVQWSGANTVVSYSAGWLEPAPGELGRMSDLQFYDSALSSAQVGELYATQSVPEPSTYALLVLSAIGLFLWSRRRQA